MTLTISGFFFVLKALRRRKLFLDPGADIASA